MWKSLQSETAGNIVRLLKGGRVLRDQQTEPELLDILIGSDGRIEAIEANINPADVPMVDLSGALVVPGFCDAHQHLDKTGVLKSAANPSGTLQGAREAFARYARTAPPEDIARRARRTIAQCRARGTTAIRSHVNVDKDAGFHGLDALSQVRSEFGDSMRLQLVAFMVPHPNQDLDWLEANIDAAASRADAIGGTVAVAEDPERYLDILFAAADRHGLPVDLHLDEHLDPDRLHFDAVIERTEKYAMQGRVVIGHASALSAVPRAEFERISERIHRNDIGVITLPAANLYLQGRTYERLAPRGLTRVADFVRSGVTIATASDNIQDPFVPTGSGDMLEIARWTLLASHLHADNLDTVFTMITHAPARLMGYGQDYGMRTGARADLVIADCADVIDLVSRGPDRCVALVGGRAAILEL
ncbi:deaminase [Devosia limi DSM 17137]|uniref:Deaminase n=1 Tax=Devosia limi DSM 17137 TaxID=1121477 RepID=A0A0F5LQG6_9HYPH|nr:amidohydrolase family protein [Devosia limi]KKB84389.1 deaminase [Devosia limi DSM 17137]SHF61872.1 cytosine deaminase [Devosia limi DSM 17137]